MFWRNGSSSVCFGVLILMSLKIETKAFFMMNQPSQCCRHLLIWSQLYVDCVGCKQVLCEVRLGPSSRSTRHLTVRHGLRHSFVHNGANRIENPEQEIKNTYQLGPKCSFSWCTFVIRSQENILRSVWEIVRIWSLFWKCQEKCTRYIFDKMYWPLHQLAPGVQLYCTPSQICIM